MWLPDDHLFLSSSEDPPEWYVIVFWAVIWAVAGAAKGISALFRRK